jgi:hypothetical protein
VTRAGAPGGSFTVLRILAPALVLLAAAAAAAGFSNQNATFAALVAPLVSAAPGSGRWLRPVPVLARPPNIVSLPARPG